MTETKETYEIEPTQMLTPQTWDMIMSIAPTMHQARLFGVGSPDQAAAIMLKGFELGLGLAASFEFVQVIQGKPTLSPRGALALIQQSSECTGIEIDEGDDYCQVTMKRKNGFSYTTRFTMDDAKQAGLVKPDSGWEKYPKNMLRWRTVGYCADVVFPDVIGGMKRADEFGAEITPEGNVITPDSEVVESQWAPVDPKPEPVIAFSTIDALLTHWTAEQIVVANEGKIPSAIDECQQVAEVLNG